METFLNMTVLIPGNNFFLFFCPSLFCSGKQKQKFKISRSSTQSHLSQEGPVLPTHACVREHSHSHTQHIHSAFQPQASLQTGFTTHIAARPPAPRPEDALLSAGGPKYLGIPSTSVLSNASSGCQQGTLKPGCSGLSQPLRLSLRGSHTTRFPLESSRSQPGQAQGLV